MNTPRTTISFSKMSAEENSEQVKVSDNSFITKNNSVAELLESMPVSEEALEKTETGWSMPGQTYSIAGEEWSWSNINNTEDTWLNNWKKRNVFEEMRSVATETSVFGRPLVTIPDSFSFL